MDERDDALNAQSVSSEAEQTAESGEMTVAGWLWRLCIPIIPCAGIIIYIILLCMWAFGKKQTGSMRVWAKAALIATVIQLVFAGVVFLVVQLNVDVIGFVSTLMKKVF